MKNKRIWELDFLRGFAIIMMVFDHLMFDLGELESFYSNFYQVDNAFFHWLNNLAEHYWIWSIRDIGHLFFISLFLLISGISFTFSKSNLKRTIKMLIVAILISVVTYIIEEVTGYQSFIIMGVIHMYALSTLITYIFRKIWDNDIFIFTVGSIIILLGFVIEFWEFNYIYSIHLDDIFGLIIGTKAFGADYFGIIPYLGVIMIGTVLGNIFYKNKVSLLPHVKISEKNIVILAGRYSLWIFVLHQGVLLVLIYLIGLIFGYTF